MSRTWVPRYESDEVALGIALAIALHALPVFAIVLAVTHPGLFGPTEEPPPVSKPVIAATLLKLGQPIDPKKLPDRIVPRERTAQRKDLTASREDPLKPIRDAGAPPPDTRESDIDQLIRKSDPFAEDAGRARPEEGHAMGHEAGTETDPNKVRAGDEYRAILAKWFHDRWQIPTVISEGEARRLCVTYQITIGRNMVIFHVSQNPVRSSGNLLFDDSARNMLNKALEDATPLPPPPPEVADQFKGRTLQILLNPHGDSSRCK